MAAASASELVGSLPEFPLGNTFSAPMARAPSDGHGDCYRGDADGAACSNPEGERCSDGDADCLGEGDVGHGGEGVRVVVDSDADVVDIDGDGDGCDGGCIDSNIEGECCGDGCGDIDTRGDGHGNTHCRGDGDAGHGNGDLCAYVDGDVDACADCDGDGHDSDDDIRDAHGNAVFHGDRNAGLGDGGAPVDANGDGNGDMDADGDGDGDGHDADDNGGDDHTLASPYGTFVEYSLCKHLRPLNLPPHPDPIVETSSLASVAPPPPSSDSVVGSEVVVSSRLSCLQIEAIFYALQRHSYILPGGYRAGFFLGDGAGVGKGRTIAGLILANWQQGRKKALWVSIGSDLRHDARRDLDDVGANDIPLHPLNKLGYGKLDSHRLRVSHGVLFLTYSSLIAKRQNQARCNATTSRLQQVLQWCGQDFDGLIVFDECHRAKNLSAKEDKSSSSRTALAVHEIQLQLPSARVVYCSATGVSELRNLGYMLRLGMWGEGTSFYHFSDFLRALNRGGVGAQELLAMEMKGRGMYLSRSLSFDGAEFNVIEVELDPGMVSQYNRATEFWKKLYSELDFAQRYMPEEGSGVVTMTGPAIKSKRVMVWQHYWGAHQRFFRQMCMSAKICAVAEMTRRVLEEGKCVVIGLQSTGEARTEEVIKERGSEGLDDFVSSPKEMLIRFVKRYFPGLKDAKMKVETDSADDESWEEEKKSTRKRTVETSKSSSIWQKSQKTSSSDSHLQHATIVSVLGVSSRGRIRKCARGPVEASCNILVVSSDSDSDSAKKSPDKDSSDYALSDEDPSSDSSIKTADHTSQQECNLSDDDDDNDGGGDDDDAVDGDSPVRINETMGRIPASLLLKGRELLREIEALELPKNPLDELIDKLGGPKHVAEMTGRMKALVRSEDQRSFSYKSRRHENTGGHSVNMHEKKKFMDGKKLVAIISEASSVGISLQADRRVPNQKRRVHIVLELPWSAEKAIQQFGRSHRSNQSSAPEYKLLFTNLGGERRFASIVAKRLETLGALTQGDRRAGPSLSAYNYHSVYGHRALMQMYSAIMGEEHCHVLPPGCENSHDVEKFYLMARDALKSVGIIQYDPHPDMVHALCIAPTPYQNKSQSDLFGYIAEGDVQEVGRFLNRSLGLPVSSQNILFEFFMKLMEKIISNARREGLFDSGIVEINARSIELLAEPKIIYEDALSSARTELFHLRIDRGISWETAKELLEQSMVDNGDDGDIRSKDNGFYELKRQAFSRKYYLLAIEKPASSPRMFRVFRPNSGGSVVNTMGYKELMSKYRKFRSLESAREAWDEFFSRSVIQCTHGVSCKAGTSCRVGKRIEEIQVLGGLVLPVWRAIENTLRQEKRSNQFRVKVVRLQTSDSSSRRIVGIQIPSSAIQELMRQLHNFKTEPTYYRT